MSTPRQFPDRPLRELGDIRAVKYRNAITPEWLLPLWLSNMTIEQIAGEAGCGMTTIQKYAKRYNLPDRPYRAHEKGYAAIFTEEYLHAAYVEEGLTAQEIAAEAGCSVATVVRHMEACGIVRRGTRPGVDNLLYEQELTAGYLEKRLGERANVCDIAREVGCSIGPVHLAIRRHGLGRLISPVRPPEPPCATAEELRLMFVEKQMSMNAIGRVLGVSKTKVRADLSRFGIRHYARPGFRATDDAWAGSS